MHPFHRALSGLAAATACALAATPTCASEGGASIYLLGSGGPGGAILPPIEGVFLVNTAFHYDGKAQGNRQFVVGGNLVAGLKANINADFLIGTWVPTTEFLGGTAMVGAAVPFGVPAVDVSAIITGPRGRQQAAITRSEDKFIVGDPLLLANIGWKRGDTYLQWANLVNVPIGDYRAGHLSNFAFHRWAWDTSLALTWRSEEAAWDISGKTGLTFNGNNDYTDYDTGTEWHAEASIEKIFSPTFSAGIQGYYFHQLTGDKGSGAVLGPFKGEVGGIGATGAYNFKIAGKIPATLRLHAFHEFGAKNRLEGQSVFLDFSMPLWVNLPPGAAPH